MTKNNLERKPMLAGLSASVAIIRAGQILLTKRADMEVWALPTGQLKAKESVAQATIREAREETGLEIQLTRLVGIYFLPAGNSHAILFAAKPVGGVLRPQAGEVLEVKFFHPHQLPEPLIWWHHQRILDALDGVNGSVVWSQNVVWPFGQIGIRDARDSLHELRDQSGLSKQEFFLQHFSKPTSEHSMLEVLEVGGEQNE